MNHHDHESTKNDSPVWSSGSGALKEMRLYDAEVKVKSLEKDNARLREHEEFYINKAREWKNRALKYERSLQENGIPVPQPRDKRQIQEKSEVNKENTVAQNSQLQANAQVGKNKMTMSMQLSHKGKNWNNKYHSTLCMTTKSLNTSPCSLQYVNFVS